MSDIRSNTRPEEASPLEPPQNAPGHYGPGYADPTRHFGTDVAGQPPAAAGEPSAVPAPPSQPAAAKAERPEADGDRPDLRSDEVGFRPPDRLPSEQTPESENAALIFERS